MVATFYGRYLHYIFAPKFIAKNEKPSDVIDNITGFTLRSNYYYFVGVQIVRVNAKLY